MEGGIWWCLSELELGKKWGDAAGEGRAVVMEISVLGNLAPSLGKCIKIRRAVVVAEGCAGGGEEGVVEAGHMHGDQIGVILVATEPRSDVIVSDENSLVGTRNPHVVDGD